MAAHTYEEILDGLQKRKEEIEELIAPQLEELKRIDDAIAKFSLSLNETARNNWSEMAVKCVTGYNQLLQTNDILECQLGEIYTKADETKKRNMTVGLSIALNNLCNNGVFRKVVIKGVKGHFYGLPDWFEANGYGELKKEYLVKLIEKTKRQRYETVTMEKQYGDIIMASRNIFG